MKFTLKITKNYWVLMVIAIIGFNSKSIAQNEAKAKAYYFAAEEKYNAKQYNEALGLLNKSSDAKGGSNAYIESLRTKIYVAKKDWTKAQSALDKCFNYNPDNEMLKDLSSLTIQIESGLEKQKFLTNAYKHFTYVNCSNSKCSYGKVTSKRTVTCSACKGRGKIKSRFRNKDGSYDYYTCKKSSNIYENGCGGSGKKTVTKRKTCSTCGGTSRILKYTGDFKLTPSEIQNYIRNNRSKIDNYLSKR